jgi:hypothetical protein
VNALAEEVEKELPIDEIKKVLSKAVSKSKLPDEIIEAELSKAVQQALDDVKTRNYQGIVKLNANVIIGLGLAIYGVGTKIKAKFAQKWLKDMS